MRLIDADKLCNKVNDIVHFDMFQDFSCNDAPFDRLSMFFADAAFYRIKKNALDYLLQVISVITHAPEVNINETDEINNAPTIDPMKHGHWISEDFVTIDGFKSQRNICSHCKAEGVPVWRFCPCCGTKIDDR